MTNRNPTTGIAFGYIRADSIDSDLLYEITFVNGEDPYYRPNLEEYLSRARLDFEEAQGAHNSHPDVAYEDMDEEEFDEDAATQKFNEEYNPDEPIHEGEHEGVKYRTSWMGGALCLWVFESPVVTKCRPCSPCVPGAGDLDSVGDYEAYGVPVDWLTEDFIKDRCQGAGYLHTIYQMATLKWAWSFSGAVICNSGRFDTEEKAWADCYEKNLQRTL